MNKWIGLAVSIGFVSGCAAMQKTQMNAVAVHALAPSPNVLIPSKGQMVTVELVPTIEDAFTVPGDANLTAVPVDGWRTTLQNAFAPFLASSRPDGAPRVTVKLHRAKIDWVMTAAYAEDERLAGAAAAVARVQFAAEILRDGVSVDQITGEVFSTQPWTDKGGSSKTAKEAVEKMVEAIAAKVIPQLG